MKLKFAPYSFSSLSLFTQCRRKFKYTKIDNAPKNKKDITHLIKGGTVHSILEHFPNTSKHKRAPKYQYIVDKFVNTSLGKKYLFTESVTEYNFGLTKNIDPCKYSDKEALFRGKIDHICVIENILHLIDWKTGKYTDEKWQNFDQLLFYAIYFFILRHNIQQIKISYVFVEHEDMENSIILDRKYLQIYFKSLLGIIKESEEETEYNKTPGPLCGYCEFKNHCSKDT